MGWMPRVAGRAERPAALTVSMTDFNFHLLYFNVYHRFIQQIISAYTDENGLANSEHQGAGMCGIWLAPPLTRAHATNENEINYFWLFLRETCWADSIYDNRCILAVLITGFNDVWNTIFYV